MIDKGTDMPITAICIVMLTTHCKD